jgi:hypothetical protein
MAYFLRAGIILRRIHKKIQWVVVICCFKNVLLFFSNPFLFGSDVVYSFIMHAKCLIGNLEGKRPVGRQRREGEDNIKADLGEIRWEGVVWIYLAEEMGQWPALASTVMILRVS